MRENNVFSQHELEFLIEKVKKNRLMKDIFKDLNKISLKIEVGDESQIINENSEGFPIYSNISYGESSNRLFLNNFRNNPLTHVNRSGNLIVKEISLSNERKSEGITTLNEVNKNEKIEEVSNNKFYGSDASLSKIISSSEEDDEEDREEINSQKASSFENLNRVEANMTNNKLEKNDSDNDNQNDSKSNKDLTSLSSLSSSDNELITIHEEKTNSVDDQTIIGTAKVVEICELSLQEFSVATTTVQTHDKDDYLNNQIIEEDGITKILTIKGHNRHIILNAKKSKLTNQELNNRPKIIQKSLSKKFTLKINPKFSKANKLNKKPISQVQSLSKSVLNNNTNKLNEQLSMNLMLQNEQINTFNSSSQYQNNYSSQISHHSFNNNKKLNNLKNFTNNYKSNNFKQEANNLYMIGAGGLNTSNGSLSNATISSNSTTNSSNNFNYPTHVYHATPYYYNYQTPQYMPVYLNDNTAPSYMSPDPTLIDQTNNAFYYMMPPPNHSTHIHQVATSNNIYHQPNNQAIPVTANSTNSKLKINTSYYNSYPMNSY